MLELISSVGRPRARYPVLQEFSTRYNYFEEEKLSSGPATRVSRAVLLLLGPVGLAFASGLAAAGII